MSHKLIRFLDATHIKYWMLLSIHAPHQTAIYRFYFEVSKIPEIREYIYSGFVREWLFSLQQCSWNCPCFCFFKNFFLMKLLSFKINFKNCLLHFTENIIKAIIVAWKPIDTAHPVMAIHLG